MRTAIWTFALLVACGSSTEEAVPASASSNAATPAGSAAVTPPVPAPAPPAPSGLRWEIIAEPATFSLANANAFVLRVVATNEGGSLEAPSDHPLSFTVNGAPAPNVDFAFRDGLAPITWSELPPGQSEQSGRTVGSLLSLGAPGDYEIVLTVDGVPHPVTVHVTP